MLPSHIVLGEKTHLVLSGGCSRISQSGQSGQAQVGCSQERHMLAVVELASQDRHMAAVVELASQERHRSAVVKTGTWRL